MVWGIPGEGIVHIAVTDNMNAQSRTHSRKAKRWVVLKQLQTFIAYTIQLRLEIVIVYPRSYHNVSADALTRQSVAQIEEWALGQDFSWIELLGVWAAFAILRCRGN